MIASQRRSKLLQIENISPGGVSMQHKNADLMKQINTFMEEQGYELEITEERMHHEIYLSDARKVSPDKLKTVIRHPIRRKVTP